MSFEYDYSISIDFPSGLAPGQFATEVAESSIGTNFTSVGTLGDTCAVYFSVALTAPQQTTLDGLVAAHVPAPNNIIFTTDAYIQLISTLADSQAVQINASNAAGGVYINSGTGGVAVTTTNAFSVSAGAAIPISTSAGNITLDTPGLIDLNAQSGINIGNDADAAPVNIGTSASARTITIGNTTGATAVNVLSGSGQILVTSTSSANDALRINLSGGIDADTAGTISFATSDTTGAAITLDASSGNGGVNIASGSQGIAINSGTGLIGIGHWSGGDIQLGTSAIARTITIGNATGATSVPIVGGTGGVLIDATGVVEINSSGGSISIGNDAVSQNINIGTSGSRITVIGNANASSLLSLVSGSWGLTIGNDASGGEVQIASSANAKTVRIGNNTSGSRIFQLWSPGGGFIRSQGAPTGLSDADATLTIGQLLTDILTITPTTTRTLTLPTAALAVAGISSIAVDSCIDFCIMNLATGVSDPDIVIAMGSGGTAVGNMGVFPRINNAGTYNYSGTGTFRMRFTNVTASSEAYTIYRIA
jgi:hypothetical protein